ncbi:MAG: SGNH/GDSL hydrolase family protein [Synergistaceae bacterium]|nr:SGNH/GDSL hydrolase family protein [Synergistaceae bacterium]
MRKFLTKIFIYTLALSLITIAVNALCIYRIYSSNFGSMSDKKNDSAFIVNVPEGIQICNFGSSHGYYGFNYDDAGEKYTCFNFALPSQSLRYDYKILEQFRDKIRKDAAVFIVISHFSFFGKPEVQGADFASKNRRYYRFLDSSRIDEYDIKTNFYVNYMPALIADNAVSFLRLLFKPSGDMWNFTTDPEAAKVHALVRYKGFIADKKDNEGRRLFNREAVEALMKIIALCHELGAAPILITTPYLKEYNDAVKKNDPEFYGDFRAVIDDVVRHTGVKYYDYSEDERYTNDYSLFFNTDHMNRKGARIFTNTLLREVLCIETN